MIQKIQGEQPFQVLATNFSISPSEQNYTLQISADGENYSDLFVVSAGQTKMVTAVANGSYYRCKYNETELSINWRTQCNDGGSGGGGGSQYILPPATTSTLGGVKVGDGLAITNEGVLSTSGGSVDSGAVQTQIDNSINSFSQELQEGSPIVGMANQLYSPDGVTSDGLYAYRTTAGDADVATGDAELRLLKGNSDYSNVETSYEASVDLLVSGEPVEDFTYEILEDGWVEFVDTAQTASLKPMSAKTMTLIDNGQDWIQFKVSPEDDIDKAPLTVNVSNGTYSFTIWDSSICTAVTQTKWYWSRLGAEGYMEFTDNMLYIWITDCQEGQYLSDIYWHNSADTDIYAEFEPIQAGESTYTYGIDGWSPELPAQLTDMEVNGSAYEPSLDDEIVIYNELSVTGSAIYPRPTSFVALGLNSFDYTCEGLLTNLFAEGEQYTYDSEGGDGHYYVASDNDWDTYVVKAVGGLEDGYVIHIDGGEFDKQAAGIASSPDSSATIVFSDNQIVNGNLVVYPTTAMPYIIFSVLVDNVENVCVHPRWSGKMDDAFEEYSESVIDLSELDCPLYSIGNVRNEIDLVNKVYKYPIGTTEFSQEAVEDLINDGKVKGVDFEYDEDYIYVVMPTSKTRDISQYIDNYTYQDNDFSVEYFVEYDENDNEIILTQPVYAETYYITNLVDKLRRLESGFVHLSSPDTEGETGKTYEYQGRIMQWVEGSGYTAEWLRPVGELGTGEGEGLIYSIIPEGQVLFEIYASSTHRSVVYSGQTLYLKEGDNVISSAAVGSTFRFECNGNSIRYIQGEFKNGHIGFYKNSTPTLSNVWDGKANNSHYELIDKYNYPYLVPAQGIPVWNNKGQVIGLNYGSINTKNIYVNATGTSTSNRLTVVTSSYSNGPDRWFAPITGGDQGQTLVSAGANAAPVWETRIKVVKITSDDYEALTTKDPNTLYIIDDE